MGPCFHSNTLVATVTLEVESSDTIDSEHPSQPATLNHLHWEDGRTLSNYNIQGFTSFSIACWHADFRHGDDVDGRDHRLGS